MKTAHLCWHRSLHLAALATRNETDQKPRNLGIILGMVGMF